MLAAASMGLALGVGVPSDEEIDRRLREEADKKAGQPPIYRDPDQK